jgi:hypothetical protein
MLLTQARLPDGMAVWLLPIRDDVALSARSGRASTAYLDQRRPAANREPLQLETVASAVSETRQVYEVVPYVPYEGYSKLSGAAAYAATQNVLGTRQLAVDDYA